MSRKTVLAMLVAVLIVLSASAAFALHTDGLISGAPEGPDFASGLFASVNPGGLGDALIYGYYNVRGSAIDLINLVNTSTADGVKVRMVFRAGINSKEILDFSICLSRGDVWSGIVAFDGTAGSIVPFDADTITAPTIPAAGQEFKFGGTTLSDVTALNTTEGYIEVLGLSTIDGYDKNAKSTSSCGPGNGLNNCITTATQCAQWGSSNSPATFPAGNVLLGNNTIFVTTDTGTYSYNATAISDAFLTPIDDPGPGSELSIPTSMPSPVSILGSGASAPSSGCTAFDWIFMKEKVISPFDLMSGIAASTDVILTFPSRLKCHATNAVYLDGDSDHVVELGDQMFDCTKHGDTTDTTKCTAYCSKVLIDVWDQKEDELNVLDFSPAQGSCLPNEVNLIHIVGTGASPIFASDLISSVNVGSFNFGWLSIDLNPDGTSNTTHFISWNDDDSFDGGASFGLPTIALTAQTFVGNQFSYMAPAFYKTDVETRIISVPLP